MRTKATRATVVVLVVGLGIWAQAQSAAAGGMDWLYPVRDRYQAGETATLVGYTVRSTESDPDTLDWSDTGPFHAYLRADAEVAADADPDGSSWPEVHPSDVDLGEPTVADTHHSGASGGFLPVRVSLTFTIPPSLAPGPYEVFICEPACTTTLGYIGGATVYVDVDPPERTVRPWPLDDPAIAELADDALLWGPDWESEIPVTAAQVRAGDLPPAPELSLPARPSPAVEDEDHEDDGGDGDEVATRPLVDRADRADRSSIGGVVPWLVAFAVLVGLWCAAWRIEGRDRKDRPPRKRIRKTSTTTDEAPDLPSDDPVTIRL